MYWPIRHCEQSDVLDNYLIKMLEDKKRFEFIFDYNSYAPFSKIIRAHLRFKIDDSTDSINFVYTHHLFMKDTLLVHSHEYGNMIDYETTNKQVIEAFMTRFKAEFQVVMNDLHGKFIHSFKNVLENAQS